MFQRNIVVIALVLLVAVVVLIFGRGLLSNVGPAVQDAADPAAVAENADLSAEQSYARDVAPVVAQTEAWKDGPLAERAVALEEKMESGALSTLTYGNFLLLYLNAQAAGKNDQAMDWIAQETVGPRLQPIYNSIATESAAISQSLTAVTPPADLGETQQRLLQCVQFENQRSQAIADVLAGTSTVEVPERTGDPCATLDADLQAMNEYIEANQ